MIRSNILTIVPEPATLMILSGFGIARLRHDAKNNAPLNSPAVEGTPAAIGKAVDGIRH
jgi:hypothetical protein